MKETILITGACGMLGRELVPLFIKNTECNLIILIHEKGKGLDKNRILKNIFKIPLKHTSLERIQILAGDITSSNLGISDKHLNALYKEITAIMHTAASTRFDLPLAEARKINVLGTKNVLDFALKCTNVGKLGFISTVYISGKRTGKLNEDAWEHTEGFVNSYEQTKYEAEQLMKKYKNKLPISTYRLSTIIGDSKSGVVNHFTAPHQALRIMYLGLAAMIPGTQNYIVDLIPSDYTALIIFNLFNSHFKQNQIFHITAGKNKSYSLEKLIDTSYELLAKFDPAWKKKEYPKPSIVSSETFDLFIESVEQSGDIFISGVLNVLKHFAHQLNYYKEFDNQNLLRSLPDYQENLPDIETYFGKVVKYSLKHKWKTH